MQTIGTPAAELAVDSALVRELLQAQHPDLANLEVEPLQSGWDNAIFKLGDALLVRLPRREVSAALLVNEQRWLPDLARNLPLPVPVPVRVGLPAANYPWHWSVVPRFSGHTADESEPANDQGAALGEFLAKLHVIAPDYAPRNPVRGVPLAVRESVVLERIHRLRKRADLKIDLVDDRLLSIWGHGLSAVIDVADTWIHGDLHPGNVLVDGGRFSAVIDWGDMARGDRATDLASIWMLLPAREARQAAIDRYPSASEDTWRRARGWAALFGVTLLDAGLIDNSRYAAMGERTIRRLVEGP